MNPTFKTILILLILLYGQTLEGQYSEPPLELVNKNVYTDGTMTGKFHHFEYVFQEDARQAKDFAIFNHNRKAQRWVNYISAAVITGGIIDGLRDANPGWYGFTNSLKTPAQYGLGLALVGNLFAGVNKGRAKKRLLHPQEMVPILLSPLKKDTLPLNFTHDFRQLSKHEFQSDSITGSLRKFEYLFAQDPVLSEKFDEYNSYRRKQISGNAWGFGITSVSVAAGFGIGNVGGAQIIIYGGSAGLFLILVSNLVNGSNKGRSKAELLSMVNPRRVGYKPSKPQFDIAMTDHGIGLVYRFN